MSKAVKKILSNYEKSRSEIIPILQEIQERFGYLPRKIFKEISEYLDISENEIFGIATFYAQFKLEPPAKHQIKVCLGTACHVCGNQEIYSALVDELKLLDNGKSQDGLFGVDRVACLGACALAPVVVVDKNVYGRMERKKVLKIINKYREGKPDYFTNK